MANAIVKQLSGVSNVLARLVPIFDDRPQDLYWRVEECNMDLGPNPSYATCILRNSIGVVDEAANSMAFNGDNNSWLRHGRRCVVEKYFPDGSGNFANQTVFIGSVVMVRHDRDKNTLIVTLFDDRWLLRDIRIVGRWIYDSKAAAGPYFQQGWGAHFNPGGRPNCIFADDSGSGEQSGFKPFFTPYPDYGLVDGQLPPDPSKRDSVLASYWTLESIFEYLWNVYNAGGIAQSSAKFPWIDRAPSTLIWPKEFAAGLDKSIVANFDVAIGQTNSNQGDARKGREVVLEGVALLDGLSMLLQTAGGYDISFEPQDPNSNILTIVPTRFSSKTNGASIPMATSGTAANVLNRAVITGGTFEESSIDYKSAAAGAGQLIFIERMVSTKGADGAQIRPSWDQNSRFNLFRALAAGNDVVVNGQTVTGKHSASAASVAQAFRVFPDIMTTWCLNETFDFQDGTDQSAYPRAPIKRPPWPTLLSVLGDAGGFDFAGMHTPVYVEVETSPSHWTVFGQFDSAEIMDNGNIYLPLMRELASSPRVWQWGGAPYEITNGMLSITLLNIRLAIAIPCDHRLTASYASPNDGLAGATIYSDNPDADRIDANLKRRDYRDCAGLYACWLRKGVYSRPQSLGWPLDQDKTNSSPASNALRSDIDTLQAHVHKAMMENNRLRKGGRPRFDGYLVTTYKPGTPVKDFVPIGNASAKPFQVNAVTHGYVLTCEEDKVYTELKFSP